MRRWSWIFAGVVACAGSSGASDTSDTDTGTSTGPETWVPPDGFEPYACIEASPDVLSDRLCVQDGSEEVHIECELEGSCAPGPVPAGTDAILVMAYNVERGLQIDGQLALFANGTLPMPDVLLMSEADRGCARTAGRNVAWEYAEALSMHHVFGVEYTELPREGDAITAPCEHGNAILSRYPIGNARLHRHTENLSWFDHEDEPRLGGRMALLADIAVGDRVVHVQSLHFESGVNDGDIRAAQAAELAALADAQPYPPIIGGDTNAGLYVFDLANGTMNDGTVGAFFEAGYADAHASLPADGRTTRPPGLIIDLIFVRDQTVSDPVVCPDPQCGDLSDHLPIWVTVAL